MRHLRGPADVEDQNDDGLTPGLPRVRRSQAEERGSHRELDWLQLTAQQQEKERMWLSQRKKSRDQEREQAHAQEPAPAANAHGAYSTEQQDMLDKGLDMLQQMRAGFGME